MVLGLAVLFTMLAVRSSGVAGRMPCVPCTGSRRGSSRLRALRLAPFALVPAIAWVVLVFQVDRGLEGGVAKKAGKDYWAKNLKTWLDAPLPDIARADVALKLNPSKHWLASTGTFTLRERPGYDPYPDPPDGGAGLEQPDLDDERTAYSPEDRKASLCLHPPHPLARGDSIVIGWRWDGRLPQGVTKNGGNTDEFVLPSGVVLTGFFAELRAVLGFMEDIGETKENKTEARRYPRDYWKGVTRAGYGATAWFPRASPLRPGSSTCRIRRENLDRVVRLPHCVATHPSRRRSCRRRPSWRV